MELKEISIFDARLNNMPATEAGLNEDITWYALFDEGEYKGFMEITTYEDIHEISFFMIPDLYHGYGYGNLMMELFLEKYIPESKPEDMLVSTFEYNGDFGPELSDIFSGHGFDISLNTYRQCELPFETVYKRLSTKKPGHYEGKMVNFAEGITDVYANGAELAKYGISVRDINSASLEFSVAAINPDRKLEALLLVSHGDSHREAVVNNLFTATDDTTILRNFLAFAVENASTSPDKPDMISFVAANEKLERVMDALFDNPRTFKLIMADAEFNLGKYIEQLKIRSTIKEVAR
ncbi:MAG: hypothetical protein J6O03_07670 [Butyrivibrio sp.]|nr:hypothetical protein [Butyrivibrio sp.]MBP3240270.1 hypothetical protein [Oribacterium sp.]